MSSEHNPNIQPNIGVCKEAGAHQHGGLPPPGAVSPGEKDGGREPGPGGLSVGMSPGPGMIFNNMLFWRFINFSIVERETGGSDIPGGVVEPELVRVSITFQLSEGQGNEWFINFSLLWVRRH